MPAKKKIVKKKVPKLKVVRFVNKANRLHDEINEAIYKYFNNPSAYPRGLYNILCALRGPDVDDEDIILIKEATTILIRAAFLGKSYTNRISSPVFRGDAEYLLKVRLKLTADYHAKVKKFAHFYWHARQAFIDLDLAWDQVNPPENFKP